MFSLFRCLFWLGVVFSQIAAVEGTDVSGFVRQGFVHPVPLSASSQGPGLGQNATQRLAGAALDAASKKCAGAPAYCLNLAKGLAGSGTSQDSLNTSDRLPAWRLRTGRLDEDTAPR
jgi:hypothetical protein